jgi:phytoene dehydrogenase-like protein
MKYDVAIVGDRFAAMAAGALLARRGISCGLIADGDPASGGRAFFERRGGFIFDFGVLADRLVGFSFGKIFETLEMPPRFLNSGRPLYYNGKQLLPIPFSLGKAVLSPLLTLKSRKTYAGLYWRLKGAAEAGSPERRRSFGEFLAEAHSVEPDLIELLTMRAALGMDVANLDSVTMGEFGELMRSRGCAGAVSMPLGGWAGAFSEFESVIQKCGDVLTGVEVKRIIFEGTAARGLDLGYETLEADAVILAIPARRLAEILPAELFSPKLKETIDGLEPLCGISLDLGLSRAVCATDGPIVTLDPYTHGLAVSNVEPSLAPRGCQLLSWFIPMPLADVGDARKQDTAKMRVKEILELIFPGIMESVVCERWLVMDALNSALPVGGARSGFPTSRAFESPNLFMLNDAVNLGGFKGEPALRAVFEAARLAGENVKR